MNVDIASRLAALRKKYGFSQENLAEQLGISRQAISKWERAEASPDTDNLITLAKLYGISLDELLNTELELPEVGARDDGNDRNDGASENRRRREDSQQRKSGVHIEDNGEVVHIGWDGIHVQDKHGDKVKIGFSGIHVRDEEVEVNVSGEGVYVKDADGKYKAKVGGSPIGEDEKADDYEDWESWVNFHDRKKNLFQRLPLGILAIICFILIGSITGLWHPAWMVFLLVPVIDSLITAVVKRDFHRFAYPVLTLVAFLWAGFIYRLWHPGWVVFLTNPVYYAIFPKKKRRKFHGAARAEDGETGPESI